MSGSEDAKDDGGAPPPANKACDLCYRSKLKCVGRENPPCQRCVTQGMECTFDGRRKSKMTMVENRISSLEGTLEDMQAQMSAVQNQLAELAALQRVQAAKPEPSPIPRSPHTLAPPVNAHSLSAILSPAPPRSSFDDDGNNHYHSASVRSSKAPVLGPTLGGPPSYLPPARSPPRRRDDVDDDPLDEASRHGPLRKTLSRYEQARRAPQSSSNPISPVATSDRPNKRFRGDDYAPTPSDIYAGSAVSAPEYSDPVDMGLVSPARGRALVDTFFKHCNVSIPIFDPAVDTWESLRRRSALCLTAILMVGAKFDDGSEDSTLQRRLQDHAEWLAKNTLFSPAPNDVDIETIQALVVLTAWGEVQFRPGGHTFRLAMESGLYRCLPHLVSTGMGSRCVYAADLDKDRPYLVGARVWLAILKSEYEMAFNHGRPLLVGDDPSIGLGRRLLDHPLALQTDSRLVAQCELIAGRQRRHLSFQDPPQTTMAQTVAEIQKENEFFDSWFADWNSYYDHVDIPSGHFLRDVLVTLKNHAILISNARLLIGVHSQADVEALSPERRDALFKAVGAASGLVHMAVASKGYKEHFLSASSLTQLGMVFASRLLIRFATLAPEAVDLRQASKEIEEVAEMLRRGPGAQLAEQIHQILERARDKRVLPPRSGPGSRNNSPRRDGAAADDGRVAFTWPEPAAPYTFDLLSDFEFAQELFSGPALTDNEAINMFNWIRNDWHDRPPGGSGSGSGW
ncbi:hypothetical protein Q8F55_004539 [Vanrija albida]|uniref:Zn(2)-C6 fungal-type domain-containing protein n=1 Tax=Vanrija albida TaxID=181172 RepID=A0ABR3Q793_9TREE